MRRLSLIAVLACMSLSSAQAQTPDYQPWAGDQPGVAPAATPPVNARMVQSGTGFFVNNSGHVITNEHVVRGCKEVMIRGAVQPVRARVIKTDAQHDLALLKAEARPPRTAFLRDSQQDMYVNDPVLVMGYPLDAGVSGRYKVKKSIILGLEGPMHEPQWIQFRDAALQGNSGGPLLDASGNVVGVIVGKTRLVSKDEQTGETKVIKQADVAIALGMLKDFMHSSSVYFRSRQSQSYYSLDQVENQAKSYIVNIHCANGAPH